MAWEQQVAKVPTSIGPILISLVRHNGANVYRYNVTVLDQTGNVLSNVIGNLADIVNNGRINQAAGILGDVLTKAESELI